MFYVITNRIIVECDNMSDAERMAVFSGDAYIVWFISSSKHWYMRHIVSKDFEIREE